MAKQKAEAQAVATDNGDPTVVESKADKFRRLANARLFKAEKALKALANLGNSSQYQYTEEQKNTLLSVVNAACKRLLDAFAPRDAVITVRQDYF